MATNEWSIFTVEASFEKVIEKLVDLQTIQRWRSLKLSLIKIDAEKRTSYPSGQVGDCIPVVEAYQWTCIPWTPCWYEENIAGFLRILNPRDNSRKTVPKTISEELQARVITFFAEDTDGLIGYEIFNSGESVEHFVYTPSGRLFWQSQLRKTPNDDFNSKKNDWEDYAEASPRQLSLAEQFVDNRFHELEIYIPDCYSVRSKDDVWIGGNSSLDIIRRTAVLQQL
ncbi:hypothetical protein [Acaryochloris sp. IP29b_bin.148]|uniref:hypothetical protein n=1 Tax=Acaryochloris sp. IP29b_bin.148 TaxID=2969218 RepID=UPI002639583E|nr:hypothetical protein [Acaryochloris sp. IP29b_bin.148]